MSSLTMSVPLKVTIIGAGLGGLACARALRESHTVTVVERWGGGHEVGAAINLGPTAVQWLETVGFERSKAGSLTGTFAETITKQGQTIHTTDMVPFQKNCKSDWLLQHRADLFNEFLRLATAPSAELGINGQPARVLWSTDAANVDIESGNVTMADGEVIESDLVVGADGLKSIVRPLVVGDAAFNSARPSGLSAFRFTVPREEVEQAIGSTRMLDRTKSAGLFVHLSMDLSNRSVIMYGCRNYDLLNLVAIVPDTMLTHQTEESWTAQGTMEDLLKCYSDFDEQTLKLLRLAKDVKLWQLRDQDPLPVYVKGRVCLVGDAAHAMTPHQGQGGTQAVEDAEALHALFGKHIVMRQSVPQLLKDFDSVRRPRASQIQKNTREAHERKTAEKLYEHSLYNWTYPGFEVCKARLDAGEQMIVV